MSRKPLVILGLGNVLLGDEGVGIHLIRELQRDGDLPAEVVDGGTLGLELLSVVAEADALILVDAADFAQAPGSIAVFRDDVLQARLARHVSPHQAGAGDLLAVGRLTGQLPARVALVGVQPESLEPAIELSATVRAALPVALAEVRRLAGELVSEDGDA